MINLNACVQRSAFRVAHIPGGAHRPNHRTVRAHSVDPLANRTVYEAGCTLPIHSEAQLEPFIKGADFKDKLTVAMCKASHCRPCKKFQSTYLMLAERFPDCVLLEITGDESPELRKLMMKWQVKTTPTFFLYRGGELVETVTGTSNDKLLNAMLKNLKDGERGRDWIDVTGATVSDFDFEEK